MSNPNRKRFIQNLLLLALVGGLALFVVTRNQQTDATLHSTLYDKSIGENAKQVIIHAEGRQDITLENNKGIWTVTTPEQFIADKAKVQHLFTLLSENADTHYNIDELGSDDLAKYGLEKERLSVSFNGVKIIFGKRNAISQKRYIRKHKQLFLVDETVSGLLEMGVDAFKPQARPKLKPVDTSTPITDNIKK